MVAAKFMSAQQIDQLYSEFERDPVRWNEFKVREFSNDVRESLPGRAAIVREFVDERLGPNNNYEIAGLILKIRREMHKIHGEKRGL